MNLVQGHVIAARGLVRLATLTTQPFSCICSLGGMAKVKQLVRKVGRLEIIKVLEEAPSHLWSEVCGD